MLRQPAFVAGEGRGNAQCKALLAQQRIAAVAGVDREDQPLFLVGEVADIALLGIQLGSGVQAGHKRALSAQGLQRDLAHAGHDPHRERDIGTVGDLHTHLGERGARRSHDVGHDIHRPPLHRALENTIQKLLGLVGSHPVVGWP